MNNPNPFVPKGSLFEQQSQRRSRLKIGVFCVLTVSVAGLVVMLIQGCKREQPSTDNSFPPVVDTSSNMMPPVADMSSNVTPPMVASNTVSIPTALPPTPVPPTPAVEMGGSEYVVVKGDTLATIAKTHGVSLKALEAANPGVDPKKLKIKQKLVIPASTKSADVAPTAMAGTADAGGETYAVKSGDNLSKIAKAHGISLKALEAANPGVDPAHIKVGQKLKIPAKTETAAPAVDTTSAPVLPPSVSAPAPAPGH